MFIRAFIKLQFPVQDNERSKKLRPKIGIARSYVSKCSLSRPLIGSRYFFVILFIFFQL